MSYELRPSSVKAAQKWVRQVHRHLPLVQGGLFATSVAYDGDRVAVGIAGNPSRVWQDTGRVYITRVAALPSLPPVGSHAAPACTMIYGALANAAKALGYREIWTYTLPDEPGTSLVAAGFTDMGLTAGGEHDRPSRRRARAIRPEPKRRWMRELRRAA